MAFEDDFDADYEDADADDAGAPEADASEDIDDDDGVGYADMDQTGEQLQGAQDQAAQPGPRKKSCLGGCLKGCGCLILIVMGLFAASIVYLVGAQDLAAPEQFVGEQHSALAVITLSNEDPGVKEAFKELTRLWQEKVVSDMEPDAREICRKLDPASVLPLRFTVLLEPQTTAEKAEPLVIVSLGRCGRFVNRLLDLICWGVAQDQSPEQEVRERSGHKILVAKDGSGKVKVATAMVDNNILFCEDVSKVEAALDRLAQAGGEIKGPLAASALHSLIDKTQDGYGLVSNANGQVTKLLEPIISETPPSKRIDPNDIASLGWDGDVMPGDKCRLRFLLECRTPDAAERCRTLAVQMAQEAAKQNKRVQYVNCEAQGAIVTLTVDLVEFAKLLEEAGK